MERINAPLNRTGIKSVTAILNSGSDLVIDKAVAISIASESKEEAGQSGYMGCSHRSAALVAIHIARQCGIDIHAGSSYIHPISLTRPRSHIIVAVGGCYSNTIRIVSWIYYLGTNEVTSRSYPKSSL